MKTLHTTEPTQYPVFWNEEWLRRAIDELDTRKMTPEERAHFARVTAANAEAVKAEQQRILAVKKETIKNLLALNVLTIEQIANSVDVAVDLVIDIQKKQEA
ncbi:hypothetical protein [Spirosoma koreense]